MIKRTLFGFLALGLFACDPDNSVSPAIEFTMDGFVDTIKVRERDTVTITADFHDQSGLKEVSFVVGDSTYITKQIDSDSYTLSHNTFFYNSGIYTLSAIGVNSQNLTSELKVPVYSVKVLRPALQILEQDTSGFARDSLIDLGQEIEFMIVSTAKQFPLKHLKIYNGNDDTLQNIDLKMKLIDTLNLPLTITAQDTILYFNLSDSLGFTDTETHFFSTK